MKNILVTGGLGYIGAHTVVELFNNGYKPIIIDNLSNTNIEVLKRLEQICEHSFSFYNEDVCNTLALTNILKTEEIHGIIHFAAFKAVGESVQAPIKYYKNNIGGMTSLLEAMQNQGINNLVFSSSCTVYGEPDHSPVNELAPIKRANSPYGRTKQMGEDILMDCLGLNTVALRYFNPMP